MDATRQAFREFRAMTHRVSRGTTIALWVCLTTTIGLFVFSALMPPQGAVDPSIIKCAGYIFAFATLFVVREAIREGLGVKMTHGDTTIQVGDMDGKPEDNPPAPAAPADDTEESEDPEATE